jgi:hypothetical protein
VSVAPGGCQPDNRATLILGELGALLLEAGLSVTDVRTSLETVLDSSAIDGDGLSFSVLPEMVIVTQTRTGDNKPIACISTGADSASTPARRVPRRLSVRRPRRCRGLMPVGSSLGRVKIDRCEESGPTRGD